MVEKKPSVPRLAKKFKTKTVTSEGGSKERVANEPLFNQLNVQKAKLQPIFERRP